MTTSEIRVLQRPIESSQYTSITVTEHLELEDIRPSIGTIADAYDNALMETVIGVFKTECIRTTDFPAGPYRTITDVELATAGWIAWATTDDYTVVSPTKH